MTRKHTHIFALVILGCLTITGANGQSQSGNISVAMNRSLEVQSLASKGDFDAVLAKQEWALQAYRDCDTMPSTGLYYALARAYDAKGLTPQASRAYRWALRRNSWLDGLGVFGSMNPIDTFYPDYVRFLLRNNRIQDAKDVFLVYMDRRSKRYFPAPAINDYTFVSEYEHEQLPIIVLFDQDPKADVWEFSPARLEAVVTILGQASTVDRE